MQTSEEWCAILIKDGGSSKETDEVFYELDDIRLTKIELPNNIGLFSAQNMAFEQAYTTYVMPLDGDDKLPRNSLEKILKTFRETNCDFAYGDFRLFGNKNKTVVIPAPPPPRYALYRHLHAGCLAVRKAVWQKVGGYPTVIGRGYADFDYFITLLEQGYDGRHCGGVYYLWRMWSNSQLSKSYSTEFLNKRLLIVDRHPTFFRSRVFRWRFLAYGSLMDARSLAANGDRAAARHRALKALRFGCLERPSAYCIAILGYEPKWNPAYRALRLLYINTIKRVGRRLGQHSGQR